MSSSNSESGLAKGFQQIAKTSSSFLDDPLTFFSQTSSKSSTEATNIKPQLSFKDCNTTNSSSNNNSSSINPSPPSLIKSSSPDTQKNSFGISFDDMEFPFLSGETRIMHVKDTYAYFGVEKHVPCTLVMTNYRISLTPNPYLDAKYLSRNKVLMLSWLNIPLSSVEKIEKDVSRISDSKVLTTGLSIICKDVRSIKIVSHAKSSFEFDVDKAFDLINGYCFPQKLEYLFAFAYSPPSSPSARSGFQFDAISEYNRLGIDDQHVKLRICTSNLSYKVCDTYPSIIVIPKNISDSEVILAASFRSGQRLPSLCWASRRIKGTLWRSAQPKAGMSGRNEIDEKLLLAIAQTGIKSEPTLFIVDCRPQTSALANRAAGAGYESQSNYPYAKLDFYNIPNIHAVRQSYQRMVSLVSNSANGNDPYFQKKIEDTQWLLYVRLILKASWESASLLLQELPVLVHCSHGWDRTSQVCAIAELLVDPFYRTTTGFKTLIQKEWLSFGHPFQWRSGHVSDGKGDDQVSQVFIQFLDCVWQLLRLFPRYFEFNSRYLLVLSDHVYSCRFGTFIFNCEYDKSKSCKPDLPDIWAYLDVNKSCFQNVFYSDTTQNEVLMPPLSSIMTNVEVWSDYFYRWSSFETLNNISDELRPYLHDEMGICRPTSEISSEFASPEKALESLSNHQDFTLYGMSTSEDFWVSSIKKAERKMQTLSSPKNEVNSLAYDVDTLHSI